MAPLRLPGRRRPLAASLACILTALLALGPSGYARPALAQSAPAPGLVADFDPTPYQPGFSMDGETFASVGASFFFVGSDDRHGSELWVTDGTPAGTRLVKDINLGRDSSRVAPGDSLGGTLFFFADDGAYGPELWASDGTADGTRLVVDTTPEPWGISSGSLAGVGTTLFFSTGTALWRSDGTPAGTFRLVAFTEARIEALIELGGALVFVAGSELWRSDGTPGGTALLKGLPAGSYIGELTQAGGRIFFVVQQTTSSLWASDGTADGTVKVSDLDLASTGAAVANQGRADASALSAGELFLFRVFHNLAFQLWRSDGTPEGTFRLATAGYFGPGFAATPGGWLFSRCPARYGACDLMLTDGSVVGTVVVRSAEDEPVASSQQSARIGGTLFFTRDRLSGKELWGSDGTTAGTFILTSRAASPWSRIEALTPLGSTLFFLVSDGVGGPDSWSLWKSDGTPSGTIPVRQLEVTKINFDLQRIVVVGGALFINLGSELFKSDGTAAGTAPFVVPGIPQSFLMTNATAAGGKLFFTAWQYSLRYELWASDGTPGGSTLLRTFEPPGCGKGCDGDLLHLRASDDAVFFVLRDAIWRSDGSVAGTRIIAQPPSGAYLL